MGRKARILDRRVLPSMNPERRGKSDVVVIYEIDGVAHYNLIVPEEQATDDGIAAAIKDQVKKRDTLTRREIDVDE